VKENEVDLEIGVAAERWGMKIRSGTPNIGTSRGNKLWIPTTL
jgi:hypothetical protein